MKGITLARFQSIFIIFIFVASLFAPIMPVASTLASASAASETTNTTIYVQNPTANFSEQVKIPINVSNAKDVGSIDISLQYDPCVLSLKTVEKGNLTQNSTMQYNTAEDGKVLIGLIDENGLNGNGSLAILSFDVLGYPGSTSALDLEATANNVTDFSAIPLKISDGVFTISGMENVTAIVSVENISGEYGAKVKVPINMSSVAKVGSLDIMFRYNPNILGFENIGKGDLTGNSSMEANTETAGTVKIALADPTGFFGNGSIAIMEFMVWGQPGDTSPLTLDFVEVHEFDTSLEIPVIKRSGPLTVTGIAFEAFHVFINNVTAEYGSKVKIPINASSITKVGSLDIVFKYNPDSLRLENVSKGDLTVNSSMESNTEAAGTVRIALADAEGFNGTGSVVVVEFMVWGLLGDKSPLMLDSAEAHEFDTSLEIPVVKRSGTLTVTGIAFGTLNIFINNVSGEYGAKVKIPINISSVTKVGSLDIVFSYNPNVLSLENINKGALTENSSIASNTETAGIVKIALADPVGFFGNGSVVMTEFMVWEQPESTSPLTIGTVEAHEFNTSLELPVIKRSGIFTVTGVAFGTPIISVSNVSSDYGAKVQIPINVSYEKERSSIGSADIVFKYNPGVLKIINVSRGELTANSSLATNMETPGTAKIALADSEGFNGSGSIMVLNFDTWGMPGDSSQLIIDSVVANEFNTHMKIPVIVRNGVFTVNESRFGVIHSCINTFTGNYSDVIQVPINVSYNTSAIGSMEFTLRYDPNILTVEKIDMGCLTKSSSIVSNTDVGGIVKTALADSTGFNGTGSVAIITFKVWGHYGDVSILALESVTANEFKTTLEIPVVKKNGIFINGGKQVSGIHVSILNMTGAIGSVLQLPIVVFGAKDVGSMDILLSYDAKVLKAVNVSEGSLIADFFDWNIKGNNVSIALIDNTGINGDGTIALVDFEVVGFARNERNVTLKVGAYDAEEFAPIPVTKKDGIFKDLTTVITPNGKEIWYDVQNITWNTASAIPGIIAPSGDLKIDISLYDGYCYKPIASNLNNTGFYLWDTKKLADGTEVPDGSSYKIKVNATYAVGTYSYDVSDNWFTIYNKREVIITPPPGLSVTEGENATYCLEIFNKQPYEDIFALTAKNIDGATIAELNQSSITIPAWRTKSVTLRLADESAGVYRVMVNATSENATGESMIETKVAQSFSVDITPKLSKTSIGGNVSYEITISNHQKVPDVFTLNVTGIRSNWFTTDNSFNFMPGEKKEVPLALPIPEDLSNVGNFSINISATSSNVGKTRNASAELIVVRDPIISDLTPANGTSSGASDVLFTWKTSCNSTTELFIKAENETNYTSIKSVSGVQHVIYVKGLQRNMGYDFYVRSNSTYGSTTSEVRNFYITNGIVFEKKYYNVTVKKDYDQRVSIYVKNTDNKPHDLLLDVISPYEDLIVGFIGAGSIGKVVTLEPSERKSVTLAIHAQDAVEENYVLTLNLTNLGKEEIHDHAYVNLHVKHPNINFTLEEIKTDPLTLTKTFRIKNYGDTINDLGVLLSDELSSVVMFKPSMDHYRLGTGGRVEFDAMPVLTEDFTGINGTIAALGSGKIVYLPVNFTLPPGKKVFIGRVPDVSIKFSEYFDNDDSPNTNPTEEELVESYLINDTKVFISQIMIDVSQDGKPVYGANVSLEVWNITSEIVLYGISDIYGTVIFTLNSPIGSYSYKAKVVGYEEVGTETRNFYINDTPKIKVYPYGISWLNISDSNSSYTLSDGVDNITLDSPPFSFKANKSNMVNNVTATLILSSENNTIEIGGEVNDGIISFNSRSLSNGEYLAFIVTNSSNEISTSPKKNIKVSYTHPKEEQSNFTLQIDFPVNATHEANLKLTKRQLLTDANKILKIEHISMNDSHYIFNYSIISDQTLDDTLHIIVRQDNGSVIINDTRSIHLEANVTQYFVVHIPWRDGAGNFLKFNLTITLEDPLSDWLSIEVSAGPQGGVKVIGVGIEAGAGGYLDIISGEYGLFARGHYNVVGATYKYDLKDSEHKISGNLGPINTNCELEIISGKLIVGISISLKLDNIFGFDCAIPIGVTTSSEAKHYGCLNKPKYTGKFNTPGRVNEENALDVGIQIHLTSPPGHGYAPFDTHVYVNNHKVGTLENTVPDGHYMFECDPSVFNYAKDGVASNLIVLDSPTMNRGYYISTSGVKVTFISTFVKIPVIAATQEEANAIVANMSGMMRNMPDFGMYPEDIRFSKTKPEENEGITINATIYNFGTAGAGTVSIQLIDNNIPIENKSIFYLPAFGKEIVSFTWSGSGGSHRISVKLNPDKTIEESDYTNNEVYKDIEVTKKTDFTPPEISNVQVLDKTTNKATITWDTDELSNSLAKYDETSGDYTFSKSNPGYELIHSFTLTGLKANTTYYYVVNSTDKSDNSAESSELSFTTFPIDVTPPESVSGLNETDKGTTWILWRWIYPFEQDFSHTMVYINGTFKANVSAPAHSYNATGLKPNTAYEIGTRTVDVAWNINTTLVNDTATTLEEDTEPPAISNISVESITINSATIKWNTNEPGDSLVKYGIESENYTIQEYSETYVTQHTIKLAGLAPNTTYYFVVNSTDPSGNSNESFEYNFSTLKAPPDITSFAPLSPASDVENAKRTFNISVNQVVNVIWQINGTEVQTNTSVMDASYMNTSAKVGSWNISAIVSNMNGTDMQSWIWNVKAASPCFIATAAYGTPLHEDIDVLRDFRDEYLMTSPIGRIFVKTYYTASPPIADVIRENEGLRTIVRGGLVKPLVYISRSFVE